MSPKTGRPPTGNARKVKVETRMSREEIERLDYCCKYTGKTRSEIIREGIDVLYTKLHSLTKKQKEAATSHKRYRHFPHTIYPIGKPRKYSTIRGKILQGKA